MLTCSKPFFIRALSLTVRPAFAPSAQHNKIPLATQDYSNAKLFWDKGTNF